MENELLQRCITAISITEDFAKNGQAPSPATMAVLTEKLRPFLKALLDFKATTPIPMKEPITIQEHQPAPLLLGKKIQIHFYNNPRELLYGDVIEQVGHWILVHHGHPSLQDTWWNLENLMGTTIIE